MTTIGEHPGVDGRVTNISNLDRPLVLQPDRVPPHEYDYHPNATLKVFLTQACNLTCPGCFNNSHLRFLTNPRKAPWYQLEPADVKRVMSEARESFDTHKVEFSGGEPTLQFGNLLEYIRFGKALGFKTQVTTNGSIIGAYGPYRRQLQPFLPPDIGELSPEEAVSQLVEAGLDNIVISVDTMHTIADKDFKQDRQLSAKAPTSVVANTLRLFLAHGYGKTREGEYNALDRYGVHLSMTASGSEWQPSFDLVKDVLAQVGTTLQQEKRGRLWIATTRDGDEITVHRNETADIGFGERLKSNKLNNTLGETIFDRNCFDFYPRSKSEVGNGIHQEIVVNYDGEIYTCAMQSYNIGSIFDNSLGEIAHYVNNGNPPEKYTLPVAVFREIQTITQESEGMKGWGEAYRRIYEIAKQFGDVAMMEKVLTMKSHSGACYALSRNPDFLEYLQLYREQN